MNCYEIFKDIIIPIVSALIGGIATFLGVKITIDNEKRKEQEKKIKEIKPYFYRIDSHQECEHEKPINFYIGLEQAEDKEWKLGGIIKNTDNAIMIIKGVTIQDTFYKAQSGNVIDKNCIVNLYIHCNESISEETNIVLEIEDILKNKYNYKLKTKDGKEISEYIEIKKDN